MLTIRDLFRPHEVRLNSFRAPPDRWTPPDRLQVVQLAMLIGQIHEPASGRVDLLCQFHLLGFPRLVFCRPYLLLLPLLTGELSVVGAILQRQVSMRSTAKIKAHINDRCHVVTEDLS